MFYLQKVDKAERVGFEPTRRLDTVYTISNPKRAPYQFRARHPNLSHCVRLVWHLAALGEVLIYPGVHCVRSQTDPVAVKAFEQTPVPDLLITSDNSCVARVCSD